VGPLLAAGVVAQLARTDPAKSGRENSGHIVMQIKKLLDARFVTVVAGAAVVALIGAGAGYSAGQITSKDIRDQTIKIKDMRPGTVKKLKGQAGPAGPVGPSGPSNVTQVKALGGPWLARATDVAGLKMTGDGVQFGPFANPGACATAGTSYSRLDYSGMNGQALSSLKNLVMRAQYTSDTPTSGVGAPTVRVFFEGQGPQDGGATLGDNRLTFSGNTQFSQTSTPPGVNYDIGEGSVHEWIVTSGTVRLNDDGGNVPAAEAPWSSFMAANGAKKITNINVLGGCSAGTNLRVILREMQINGQHYEFGG
jgi:hypothetical protein